MTKLPNIDKIALDLYEAASNSREQRTGYLGMSQIGDPCERKLFLSFRGFKTPPIDGKAVMIFRFGDLIEQEIIHWLKLAGYQVDSTQSEYSDHNGLFKGHCDGVIHGVTSQPHILEIKSANDTKFKAFKDAGVKQTYPVYYAQVQCYMGYSGLERTLFVVQNKNNSEIYTERMYFYKDDFNTLREKAYRIINADSIPERQFNENDQQCRYCNYKFFCWYPEETIMSEVKTCNTCTYIRFKQCDQWCRHPKHPYEIVIKDTGCADWIDMFKKRPEKIEKVDLNK